jgi:hypothetical protein
MIRSQGSTSAAIVAILALVILAGGAYFLFLHPHGGPTIVERGMHRTERIEHVDRIEEEDDADIDVDIDIREDRPADRGEPEPEPDDGTGR